MKRTGSGFTIVELLIVIVVIAILAAITIVSYNGIIDRARNTELLARVDAYTKAFQLYATQNGSYPAIVASEAGNTVSACLGTASDYPQDATFASGNCGLQSGTVYNVSPTLMNQLATFTKNLPSGALPTKTTATNSTFRGILYVNYSTSVWLTYSVGGDQDCARGSKSYNSATKQTVCSIILSNT